jgi:hypothetical protein
MQARTHKKSGEKSTMKNARISFSSGLEVLSHVIFLNGGFFFQFFFHSVSCSGSPALSSVYAY